MEYFLIALIFMLKLGGAVFFSYMSIKVLKKHECLNNFIVKIVLFSTIAGIIFGDVAGISVAFVLLFMTLASGDEAYDTDVTLLHTKSTLSMLFMFGIGLFLVNFGGDGITELYALESIVMGNVLYYLMYFACMVFGTQISIEAVGYYPSYLKRNALIIRLRKADMEANHLR